jgi:cell volume regulation protein A
MHELFQSNIILLAVAGLLLVGVLSSLVAQRFGAPLLLVFLVIGMLVGEEGPGGVVFNDYRSTYFVGTVALAIILFDGGLRARVASFRGALAPAVALSTVGVVATAAIAGVAATWLLGLEPLHGLLVGAMVSCTDAAAVFFLLRAGGLKLRRRVNAILEIESGTNDPVAVFLTLLLVQLVLSGPANGTFETVALLARQGLVGGALGIAGGLAIATLINRIELPGGLHPLFVIAAALAVFALAAVLDGSGFLAVYVAGLIVGNRPVRAAASIAAFHDTATWLCQIAMFILLGLLVTPSRLLPFLLPSLGVAAVLTFVARPMAVALCLVPFRIPLREQAFVAWVGLRGAVSIFLAAIPTLAAIPGAEVFFNVAFVVVLASLVVQGWTITPFARVLGLALPGAARPVSHVEIDLPGQLAHELVGYPVAAATHIRDPSVLPRWARPVFVVRGGEIVEARAAGPLAPGDYAYFLAPPERVADLDRLFAPDEESGAAPLLPVFPIDPAAPVASLASLYGLTVAEEDVVRSVGALFRERFRDGVEPGDVVALDGVRLVARLTEGGRVVEAGLVIADDEAAIAPPAQPSVAGSRLRSLQRFVKRVRG